jgi:hypothetical protein
VTLRWRDLPRGAMLVFTHLDHVGGTNWSTVLLLTGWQGRGKGFRILSSYSPGLLEVYDTWAAGVDPEGRCPYPLERWIMPPDHSSSLINCKRL